MSFTRPYVLRISAIMATSANQQGVVGADSGAIWMWTEACVILRGYSPFKMTFCFVDLLRRHLFLSFYNASPLLSTFSLISPACLLSSRCATRGKWRKMPSQETKRIVARAIIEKVQKAGVENTVSGLPW